MRVILAPDQGSTVVSVSVTYDAGSRNEGYDQTGLAHLCEHLMFKGSKHVAPGEHEALIQKVGGYCNAVTTKDRTTYYDTLPASQLRLALFLEADRMRPFEIHADRIEQVRGEVLAEKRERHDDVPNDDPLEKCDEIVYSKFPYGHDTLGSDLNISSLTFSDVQQFYKTRYAPSHAAISICGRFDAVQARSLLYQYFAHIPAGKAAPVVDCAEPFASSRITPQYVDAPRSPEGLYIRGYATVSVGTPDYYPLLLASDILTRSRTSRLRRGIVDGMGATSVMAVMYPRRGPSLFSVRIKYPLQLVPEQLARAVDAELLGISRNGVSQEELTRACAQEQARLLADLDSTQAVAEALSTDTICEGDPGHVNADIDALRHVTPSDVRRVVQKYLANDRMCEVYSYAGASHHSAPSPLDVAAPIKTPSVLEPFKNIAPIAPDDSFTLPTSRVVTCPNGLRIVLVEDHRLPIVTMHAYVAAGLVDQVRPGIATMTAQMLGEGTQRQTWGQIYGCLEDCGASLSTSTSMEYTDLKLTGLSPSTDKMLTCMSGILRDSVFPAGRLSKIKSETAGTQLDYDFSATSMFADLGLQALVGASPYLQRTSRSSDVDAMSREDIVSFYGRCYRPNRTIIALAGDIHPEQVIRTITDDFAGWKPGDPPHRPALIPNTSGSHSIFLVDWPRNKTSYFEILCRTPQNGDPDFFPFAVAVCILASGPASRLHRLLRERLSETYDIWSQVVDYQTWSYWECRSAVPSEDSKWLYKLLHNEIARIQAEGVTVEELNRAKRSMSAGLQRDADTPDGVAGMTVWSLLIQRGADYDTKYLARLRAVSIADVRRAAKKYLAEDRLSVIAIGPRKYLEGTLSSYGHVDILDYGGRHVK